MRRSSIRWQRRDKLYAGAAAAPHRAVVDGDADVAVRPPAEIAPRIPLTSAMMLPDAVTTLAAFPGQQLPIESARIPELPALMSTR